MMNATIRKWGNSLAVRIPNAMAQHLRVGEGDAVELRLSDEGLLLRPERKRFALAELTDGITAKNRHEEIDWGKRTGREAW